ncbi:hypothetical protein ACIP68_13935 [Streptomyces griseoviridis]
MGTRDDSDEAYVVGLCNQVLGETALTQHKFDWLQGDPGTGGRRAELPVDAYWPATNSWSSTGNSSTTSPCPISTSPTGSPSAACTGASSGHCTTPAVMRRFPAHGLRLIVIRPADLDADGRGRLRRNQETDLAALKRILARHSDEDRVTDAFRTWLLAEGWTPVDPTDRWTDLEAVRGDERLICEAKGRTSEKGIDADIAYGQLLRRMTSQEPHTRYVLVVPSSSVKAVERVPAHVRRLLRIDVYEVTDDDVVRRLPA